MARGFFDRAERGPIEEGAAVSKTISLSVKAHHRRNHHVRRELRAVGRNRNVPDPSRQRLAGPPKPKDQRCIFPYDNGEGANGAARANCIRPVPEIRFSAKRPIQADDDSREVWEQLVEMDRDKGCVAGSIDSRHPETQGDQSLPLGLPSPQDCESLKGGRGGPNSRIARVDFVHEAGGRRKFTRIVVPESIDCHRYSLLTQLFHRHSSGRALRADGSSKRSARPCGQDSPGSAQAHL